MVCECRLAQDRVQWRTLVDTVIILRVAQKEGNFLSSCATTSFSKKPLLHGISQSVITCNNYQHLQCHSVSGKQQLKGKLGD